MSLTVHRLPAPGTEVPEFLRDAPLAGRAAVPAAFQLPRPPNFRATMRTVLMQLMPGTAEEMQVAEPFEAEDNIMGGSRYLRKMLNLFEGDLQLSLAAYNAGPNKVLEYERIPRIPETEQYVEKVLFEYGKNRTGSVVRQ